jgi:hypothetical protein
MLDLNGLAEGREIRYAGEDRGITYQLAHWLARQRYHTDVRQLIHPQNELKWRAAHLRHQGQGSSSPKSHGLVPRRLFQDESTVSLNGTVTVISSHSPLRPMS